MHRPVACPAAAVLLAAVLAGAAPSARAQQPIDVLGRWDGHEIYSACAPYVASSGREFALVASLTGTAVVDLADPRSPREAAFVPGLRATSREIVTYGEHAYVSAPVLGSGIQIIRLRDPFQAELVATYDLHFDACASIAVDASRGVLYACGATFQGEPRGVFALSLEDPERLVEIGNYAPPFPGNWLGAGSAVRADRLYLSVAGEGTIAVLDVSDPASPQPIESRGYSGAYAATYVAVSRRGDAIYASDAGQAQALRIVPVQYTAKGIPTAPLRWNLPSRSHPHRLHVKDDTLFVAALTAGLRVLDIGDPLHPAEFARLEAGTPFEGGTHGAAGIATFPSGLLAVTDVDQGLVVGSLRQNYGTVRLTLRDQDGAALSGAAIRAGDRTVAVSGLDGVAAAALDPGSYGLEIRASGFEATHVVLPLARRERAEIAVRLHPLPASDLRGSVASVDGGAPVAGADVAVAGTPIRTVADSKGEFLLPGVPLGLAVIRADRTGFAPAERTVPVDGSGEDSIGISMVPATVFAEADLAQWSTADATDDVLAGQWVYGTAPVIVTHEGLAVSPTRAREGASGAFFLTAGQGVSPVPVATLLMGRTTLTSPPLPVAGAGDPVIGFWLWFVCGTPDAPESLLVEIGPAGGPYATAATYRRTDPAWRYREIRVNDWAPGADTVQCRFTAIDREGDSRLSAGVDDVILFDAASRGVSPPGAPEPTPKMVIWMEAPYPSPTRSAAAASLRINDRMHLRVEVFDVAGRRVSTLFDGAAGIGTLVVRWNGRTADGRDAASGVYFIRARGRAYDQTVRVVKMK